MKWKLYFSSNSIDRKHQALFRRYFGVNPTTPDITQDPKYKFFTKSGALSYAVTVEHWIPATNNVLIEYDGKMLPTYNYMYAVALDDNGNPLPYDYCFFVTDYDIVSARTIRFYIEPDDFQNYFNLQLTGTMPNHYIYGTCIQTNDKQIANSNALKYRIIEPAPVGGSSVVKAFPDSEYIVVVLYKGQSGITIGALADFKNDTTQITKYEIATSIDFAKFAINGIAGGTTIDIYKWQDKDGKGNFAYVKAATENIEVYDAYILPADMFNLKDTTLSPRLTFDRVGGIEGYEIIGFNPPTTTQDVFIMDSTVDFERFECSFGTNMHRFPLNPTIEEYVAKLTLEVGQGQLKIQMSFNGQVAQIEDDFETPVIFSSAAQQYAQQSIFRAINAVKGGIGVVKDVAEMKPVNALTGAISIAESFIPPQSTMQVTGSASGLLNLRICNGIGLFYWNSENGDDVIAAREKYGYNVCTLTTYSNEVLSTDEVAENWYKFNNAQFITQFVPIAKRQAIEQMFNDGIFITKVYNVT